MGQEEPEKVASYTKLKKLLGLVWVCV